MDKIIPICRLCLESEKLSVTSMEDETFRARLTAVSNFLFEDNEKLPSKVCSECAEHINQFYAFMEKVRCNQEKLRLSDPLSSIQIKKEIVPEPSFEEFEPTVKLEPVSPEQRTETIDVVVEMYQDPTTAQKNEDGAEAALPFPIKDEERIINSKEDRLIKEFFSLTCDTCSESFETFKQLKTHAKKIHKAQAVLQCCNKSFSFKRKMLFHINNHLKPFKCDVCGKGFPDNYTLNIHHSTRHTSNDEKPFKCDKCTRSFQTEQILRSHLRRHVQAICPICKRILSNKSNLKAHMAIVHNEERKFMCDVCGKDFKSRGAMNSHSLMHKELKREDGVQCEICHKWISRKTYLRTHMSEVHQAKELSCDVCHKIYPSEKSLATHKGRVHVEDKFECEICGKRFKRSVNLKEHRASHTGQKLYSCEFCGMEMNSNGNLYSHKKNKHPKEWLQAKQKATRFPDLVD